MSHMKVRDKMQIVIDIPDVVYERFGYEYREENCISKYTNDIILNAFCNGTPLPKGHGRLIDADDLDLKRIDIILSGEVKDTVDALSKMGMLIITAPTVIEADEAESEVEE